MSSSRYCAVFLVAELLLVNFLLKVICCGQTKKRYFTLLLLSFFVYTVVDGFSSFRNRYVLDIKEIVHSFISQENKVVFADKKDYRRFIDANKDNVQYELASAPDSHNDSKIRSFFYDIHDEYDFWKDDALFIIQENKQKDYAGGIVSDVPEAFRFQKKMQFFTNRKKTKTYSVYSHEHFLPPLYLYSEQNDYARLMEITGNGILKLCILKYDFYIIQESNRLVWVIGSEIKDDDWIVYHLYTNMPDLLPKERIKHKFDNRSFQVKSFSNAEQYGRYKVFYKGIPKEYPISKIVPGLNLSGDLIWLRSFRPDSYSLSNRNK